MDIWNKLWRGELDSPVAVGKTGYGFKRGARDICGVALLGLLAACSGTDTDFDLRIHGSHRIVRSQR